MSVKGKIKRLNREIKGLHNDIENIERVMIIEQNQHIEEVKKLENLIKFFAVNQVDNPAEGGIHIDKKYIDELNFIDINVWYESYNKAYVIKIMDHKEVSDG